MKRSAASLKNVVEKEQVFWEEALDIRRNNWLMQANSQPGGSSISVQYGFTEGKNEEETEGSILTRLFFFSWI